MKIIDPMWKKKVECCYCGCLMEIVDTDVKKITFEDTYYYVTCLIAGCYKDTTLEEIPTSVKEIARDETYYP